MDLKDITSFKWATVKANLPLSIQLDGDTTPLALIPDSLIDPLSLSVGSRVRVELSLRKVVVHGVANGSGSIEPGRVELTAAGGPPSGWLFCQGQSLLRSQYPALFQAIGIIYGAPDSTRFNLPDLRGRVAVGSDASQTEFNSRAKTGGQKTTRHGFILEPVSSGNPQDGGTAYQTSAKADLDAYLQADGSSAVNIAAGIRNLGGVNGVSGTNATEVRHGQYTAPNLQPYAVLNYIIKI